MNRMKITAIALATLAIGATSAQAGCKFSQISGKTFAMSATATDPINPTAKAKTPRPIFLPETFILLSFVRPALCWS